MGKFFTKKLKIIGLQLKKVRAAKLPKSLNSTQLGNSWGKKCVFPDHRTIAHSEWGKLVISLA